MQSWPYMINNPGRERERERERERQRQRETERERERDRLCAKIKWVHKQHDQSKEQLLAHHQVYVVGLQVCPMFIP